MSLMLTLSTGVCHLRHCDLCDQLSAIVYDMIVSLSVVESWRLLQPLFFLSSIFSRATGATDSEPISTLWRSAFDRGGSSFCLQVEGQLLHINDTLDIFP